MARGVRLAVRPAADDEPAGRVPRVHRQVPRRADPRARDAPAVTHPPAKPAGAGHGRYHTDRLAAARPCHLAGRGARAPPAPRGGRRCRGLPWPRGNKARPWSPTQTVSRPAAPICYTPGSCRGRYHTDRQPFTLQYTARCPAAPPPDAACAAGQSHSTHDTMIRDGVLFLAECRPSPAVCKA